MSWSIPYDLAPYDLARDTYISRLTIVITSTCLIYDYILTYEDEMRLLWSSRLSTTKLAFFANRYIPFIATLGMMHTLVMEDISSLDTCRTRFLIFNGFLLAEFLIAAFIVYTRVYAIWGCKSSMFGFLSVIYIIVFALSVFFSAHFIDSSKTLDLPLFSHGCLLGLHTCDACMFSMIVIALSEALALALILVKAYKLPNSTIMHRMTEDGIFYFIIVACVSLANVVAIRLLSPTLCNFLLAAQSALQSICCNHLVFRIKDPSMRYHLSFKGFVWSSSNQQTGGQTFSNNIEMVSAEDWTIKKPECSRSQILGGV